VHLSRVLNPPQIHQTQTVKAVVNLLKDSLTISPPTTTTDVAETHQPTTTDCEKDDSVTAAAASATEGDPTPTPRPNCIRWNDSSANNAASIDDAAGSEQQQRTAGEIQQNLARIRFRFDALEDCQIRILLCAAHSSIAGQQLYEPQFSEVGEETHYVSAGMNQTYGGSVIWPGAVLTRSLVGWWVLCVASTALLT
jgi:hypothetical protein